MPLCAAPLPACRLRRGCWPCRRRGGRRRRRRRGRTHPVASAVATPLWGSLYCGVGVASLKSEGAIVVIFCSSLLFFFSRSGRCRCGHRRRGFVSFFGLFLARPARHWQRRRRRRPRRAGDSGPPRCRPFRFCTRPRAGGAGQRQAGRPCRFVSTPAWGGGVTRHSPPPARPAPTVYDCCSWRCGGGSTPPARARAHAPMAQSVSRTRVEAHAKQETDAPPPVHEDAAVTQLRAVMDGPLAQAALECTRLHFRPWAHHSLD